jgi:hypothetical protein
MIANARKNLWVSFLCILPALTAASYGATIGTYTSHTQNANRVDITVSNGMLRIYFCDANIVRVSFDTRGTFSSTQDVLGMADVNRVWSDPGVTVVDGTDTLSIATSSLKIRLRKTDSLRLSFFRMPADTLLTQDVAGMNSAGTSSALPVVTFAQGAGEHFYGWGDAFQWFRCTDTGFFWSLDKKGYSYSRIVSASRETACYMYSTGGYGLFFLFAEPYISGSPPMPSYVSGAGYDLTGNTQKYFMSSRTSTTNSGGTMNYASYFLIAGSWKTAMSGYTLLSGRPPRLGKKFYGIMRDMYFRNDDGYTYTSISGWIDMFRSNRFNMDWVRMDNFEDWTALAYTPAAASACWRGQPAWDAVQYCRSNGFYFGGMSFGWGYQGCCSPGCTNRQVNTVALATTAVNNGFDWAWYDAMNFQGRIQAQQQFNVWAQAHNDETKAMISRGWMSLSSQRLSESGVEHLP